jgi:hypothetical protein
MTVRGKRSKQCDEQQPQFLAKDESIVEPAPTGSGVHEIPFKKKYRLSEAFASERPPIIQTLSCYEVEMN